MTESKYKMNDEVTLYKDEPTKTIYAVWEKNEDPPASTETTYTVIYTDGVDKITVFAEQVYKGLKVNEKTPAFGEEEGKTEIVTDEKENSIVQPKRDGYTFMGWAPAVNPVVSADDADKDHKITYTATWQKNEETDLKYKVEYEWNLPAGAELIREVPATAEYKEGAEVTVDSDALKANIKVTVGEGELAKTYGFKGWKEHRKKR